MLYAEPYHHLGRRANTRKSRFLGFSLPDLDTSSIIEPGTIDKRGWVARLVERQSSKLAFQIPLGPIHPNSSLNPSLALSIICHRNNTPGRGGANAQYRRGQRHHGHLRPFAPMSSRAAIACAPRPARQFPARHTGFSSKFDPKSNEYAIIPVKVCRIMILLCLKKLSPMNTAA